jgi:hypothetical protein
VQSGVQWCWQAPYPVERDAVIARLTFCQGAGTATIKYRALVADDIIRLLGASTSVRGTLEAGEPIDARNDRP